MNIRDVDLAKLNSITKYPSISTYHAIGDKGRLTEEVLVPFDADDEIVVTEKVDGTNARIIVWTDDRGEIQHTSVLIGSREELLTLRGDLLFNSSQGIVEALQLVHVGCNPDGLRVVFGEVYGGKIQAVGKMYSPDGKTGFRIFDAFEMSFVEVEKLLAMSREEIAHWRDTGGQPFMSEKELQVLASSTSGELTPRLTSIALQMGDDSFDPDSRHMIVRGDLPGTTIRGTQLWLHRLMSSWSVPKPTTRATIDGPGGKPEGVVIRTPDRKKIAKLRFEDYERTLRVKR